MRLQYESAVVTVRQALMLGRDYIAEASVGTNYTGTIFKALVKDEWRDSRNQLTDAVPTACADLSLSSVRGRI